MSLSDARRVLQWNVVVEALAAAGIDADTVKLVEHARDVSTVASSLATMLQGGADTEAAKNYVKVEMVGLIPPFERAYVELVRPGGMTSHELREMMRDRLEHIRHCLGQKEIALDAFRTGIIQGIDEDLAKERP